MKIIGEKVECSNRYEIPLEGETIADDFKIELMLPHIDTVNYYLRKQEECPFNRGNWIIDIRFIEGNLFCIKLPKEMTEENVIKFIKPLTDLLNKVTIIDHKITIIDENLNQKHSIH